MQLYQHFRKEEETFIDLVLSWKEQVERTFQRKLTDFLDPREQQIVKMLIGSKDSDLQLRFDGGHPYTERKRVVIAPFYEELKEVDSELCLLQASFQTKFVYLTHRDVMGACLSLGVKRKKLGDMDVSDGNVQIIVASEIVPYVMTNLTMIKHARIQLKERPLTELTIVKPNWMEQETTIASLRLDVVVKEIYRVSRKEAVGYINKQYVKVNHKLVDDAAFILQEGDMLSVRGKGRSKLMQIKGRTRKDKVKVTFARLK
ncbi:YlmH family RNA-binding protein [Virgibacillus proomii]|uniref:YlmH family RNA-binding protein n=1 Tax=Virgibacillus proomii TaxID=84407 RepID=UPI001C0FE9D9|nr:YlmH/Sll1252 family protein [Virgibacillus proomii]MBU5266030.1 RNA-binding protein [Virgibacillus proomii]